MWRGAKMHRTFPHCFGKTLRYKIWKTNFQATRRDILSLIKNQMLCLDAMPLASKAASDMVQS